MITVFYDGQCGLCAKEIKYYQRIAPLGIFNWQDITQTPEPFLNDGFLYSDGLKRLHAKDAQGHYHIGVDAFILIWRHIPRWKILARIVSIPGIHALVGLAYKVFANWRFKRLPHCMLAQARDETANAKP